MAPVPTQKQTWKSYAVIFLFTALGGLSLWYWGPPTSEFLEEQERIRSEHASTEGALERAAESESGRIVQRYLSGLQNGVCSTSIEMTWWMQERLAAARGTGGDTEDQVLDELCDSITARTSEGSVLVTEGVEDQYLIAPLAQVVIIKTDEGRQDLGRPTRERVWVQVTYPVPTHAIRDANGTPIKSLNAGLNVSTDGYVLKAGLLGNFEIDFDSISYLW